MKNLVFIIVLTVVGFINFGIGQIVIPNTGEYTYSSDKIKLLTLPMTAFSTLQGNHYQFERDTISASYKRFQGGNGSEGYASAPVELPSECKITQLRVWLHNTDILNNTEIIVSLVRSNKTSLGIIPDTLAKVTSFNRTIFPSEFVDLTVENETIDNQQYTYSILVECNRNNTSNARFFGAQLYYAIRKVY